MLTVVLCAGILASCGQQQTKQKVFTPDEEGYLAFLNEYMPEPDRALWGEAGLGCPGEDGLNFWEANVRKTVEVRERMGWDIPEREFRHFVLPLRANNESLDSFRLVYADSLCDRVAGLGLAEAALEINHWCHERATYRPSDARTSSPMMTIRAGLGRCGEESVLAVAALRAAGIPARQVYTPRWAHTDDNHAWVEVWVDGSWHFLGACEPEPVLDLAWFNAPVSRAMLLHTKVFGDYYGDEDVIQRTPCYTEINVIRGYVPARRSTVTVLDESGKAVKGAKVEFKIYNYAEFYTVATYETDRKGQTGLDMGLGDMVIWAYKGDRFGISKVSGEEGTVVLDHRFGEEFSMDIDIVPPVENPIPSSATAEQTTENARRLAVEDAIRAARPKGNGDVLNAFRARYSDRSADAEELLASLSAKDMNDVPESVLDEAMAHACTPFDKYIDSPRIEYEQLLPYFGELSCGEAFEDPIDVADWVKANVRVDDSLNPQGLREAPMAVWRSRIADRRSRDIFYVALCRANGFAARIDEVTGKTQYRETAHVTQNDASAEWVDIALDDKSASEGKVAPQGTLTASYEPLAWLSNPLYYRHFSMSKVNGGPQDLLTYSEDVEIGWSELLQDASCSLDEGYYMMTTGTRLASGGVLVHVEFFNIHEGEQTEIPLVMRTDEDGLAVIGSFDADPYLPYTGRGFFLVSVLGDKDEPSTHARRQLASIETEIAAWGRPAISFKPSDDVGGANVAKTFSEGAKQELRLPVVAVADSFGRIVYLSQGYNTSLADDLRKVLSQL